MSKDGLNTLLAWRQRLSKGGRDSYCNTETNEQAQE